MSNATPRLIARTTTRKLVLLLVTTVTEVFETTGETVEELPAPLPGLRKATVSPAPALRAVGGR